MHTLKFSEKKLQHIVIDKEYAEILQVEKKNKITVIPQ